MPPKHRHPKQRRVASFEQELHAWRRYFWAGHDYLRELGALGFTSDTERSAAARDAWQRLGTECLSRWPTTPGGKPYWAQLTFGEPDAR